MEEIDKNKYIGLLRITKRKGIEKLIKYLENDTDFFTCPASTKYHLSCNGGLLLHSIHVYYELIKEVNLSYTEEELKQDNFISSVILVSLLHDICKANFYTTKERNIKNSDGIWVREKYYNVEDKFPIGHGEKSVILIQRFIKLTDEEIYAIRWHMGGFESKDNYQYINKAFNKCKLAVLLHIADMKATYLVENNDV